jgi:S-adenosyl-L-methionine hydrolase (adenosine-forming)
MPPSFITFLTDFGLKDEYVGVMKGVVATISPETRTIDISHEVSPQDIETATRMIQAAYPYFPIGTIHVIVVDPGVGSSRAAIAMAAGHQIFISPDNGLLWEIAQKEKEVEIRRIEKKELFLSPVSGTFHGRDIFAPVAAHLSGGLSFKSLGPVMETQEMVHSAWTDNVSIGPYGIDGQVIAIDHFGNLISNISTENLRKFLGDQGFASVRVSIEPHDIVIHGISDYYASKAVGEPLAVIGSRNGLEIALFRGSAQKFFSAKVRSQIHVTLLGDASG